MLIKIVTISDTPLRWSGVHSDFKISFAWVGISFVQVRLSVTIACYGAKFWKYQFPE